MDGGPVPAAVLNLSHYQIKAGHGLAGWVQYVLVESGKSAAIHDAVLSILL
jgi:hypothetical protein